MVPNKTTLEIREQVRFRTLVGQPGYLVLIEKGTSGKTNLLFPFAEQNGSIDVQQAYTDGSKPVDIPGPDQAFEPDEEGFERVKAILFSTREQAATFLNNFPKAGASREVLKRDLQKVSIKKATFYTSDFTFEVSPKAGIAKPGK
jgi:hypothetical protein